MSERIRKYLLVVLLAIVLVSGRLIVENIFNKKENRFNISYLSKDFVDEYFEKISKINSDEEKENMLIVISDNKIRNSYGAKNIIEAPNNQYILQYNSEEEKNAALKKFKNDKSIDSVEKNDFYTTEEVSYNSWGIEEMSLDYAIVSTNSKKEYVQQVTVAIIDTGCDMALFNKYYGGKVTDFYNVLETSTTVMEDEDGHGTHVAGTIAEGTPDNIKILPIKVSRNGKMYISDVIAAINYIVYNDKAQVINMSFGGYSYNAALEQAIESARENNIISVAAAGNKNTSRKHYPSSLENTISIASVDSNLNKSTFSNYGAEITFTAPGTNIRSIMGKDASISKENGNNDDDDHEIISGTSMATPHAVAAVAILKGYNKDLTLENVVSLLKESALDLGEEGWDKYYGNGLISFRNVEFCDGTRCDALGVYKDLSVRISNIEVIDLNLTQYNYYSITNIMSSKVKVSYTDGTSKELTIGELPNVEILNYDPTISGIQTVTIKVGAINSNVQVTNPTNYESGWEYNILADGKIEITGYKSHNSKIEKLYVPETIDSKQVISFADNLKLNDSGNDFKSYIYLYLPSSFTRIGNYALSGTNIKYIYDADNKIEVGAHALENSKIVSIDSKLVKIEDYAFKDCYELESIEVWEEQYAWNYGKALNIGNYAFYNCKKLESIGITPEQNYNIIGSIGDYAFYNCVSLAYFSLEPGSTIGDYAFYGTYLLTDISLHRCSSIGRYAFYGSGIFVAEFNNSFEIINESAFENCRNLKDISLTSGRIESRAFWGSGVETIFLGAVEYIAEDAFAYAPIKSQNGKVQHDGAYQVVYDLGIVENGNKLLVGFTNALGASNTIITENITEIGNYAFTGNDNLKKITIPANVTKIGVHTFEDCYQLSDVYMLGNTINFDNNTFKRNYEGEINGKDLNIYVYKNSSIKQIVKDKGLNYRHIDPDEIVITNYKDTYKAKSQVDSLTLEVKLIYHEEEDHEEVLNLYNSSIAAPISNGVGFLISYQNEKNYWFEYGDTYFTIEAKNSLGYSLTKKVNIKVEKEIPTYTVPTGLTAILGQKLSEIALPEYFEWMDGNQVITGSGEVTYKAKYVPADTKNYEIVENIDVTITVSNGKTIINPEIVVGNKIYDGTTNIPLSSINISNLNSSEYTIVSAVSSSANAGDRAAIIVLRLSNEKFNNYSFSEGQQEKEFTVNFKILKSNIKVTDNSKNVTIKYDGKPHSINIDINSEPSATIKYMNSNNEYTLDEVPSYTKVGIYTIKYKLYINDNYNEYFGQKTLTIEDEITYVINKYDVDETNKYINKIMVNTEINNFISNIKLGSGYGVDVDKKVINNKSLLYTGGKTRIKKGSNVYREYTNIVIGDINGDALINSADLLKIRQHLLGTNVLTGAYFLSSDINYDNKINSADLLKVRQHLLGTKPIG